MQCCTAAAQTVQHFYDSQSPTGEMARAIVARRPELMSVMQPVLLKVPEGSLVAVAEGGGFSQADFSAQLVSMQVGETYRLKVGNVENRRGDVYPSVELLDRMHAPPGKETRYPIPIEMTKHELQMALDGKYVTRVIYVEDPRQATPLRELPEQQFIEVMAHEDPVHVATRLGRPVAILRMGSVAPASSGVTPEFTFGSPPLLHHAMASTPKVRYEPRKLDPSELPAQPKKRILNPNAPELPDADNAVPNVELRLPEREPAPAVVGDVEDTADDDALDGFEEDNTTLDDEMPEPGFGDDPFGDIEADGDIDEDPFADDI